MPARVVIHHLVQPLLQLDHLEERDLEEVHWYIELQHEGGKDDIGIVEFHYDEYTECVCVCVGGGGGVGVGVMMREGRERERRERRESE